MSAGTAQAGTQKSDIEFVLTARDFDRVASRVYDMAGIVLEQQKQQMIHARLSRVLRNQKMTSFEELLDRLDKTKNTPLHQDFMNAITTNLTSFFRENHHFEHFDKHVLAAKQSSGDTKLRIWSAGCSSGEEPYSIALTILNRFNQPPVDFKILASDLDTKVLDKAKSGNYPADKVRQVLTPYARHISKDATDGSVQIGKSAQALIAFRQLNLMHPWPMSGPFDVIFCRNVLIYFNPETKATLINRYAAMLPPGAFLYLGHSESILGDHPKFENLGQTIYRRRSE